MSIIDRWREKKTNTHIQLIADGKRQRQRPFSIRQVETKKNT